jgi:hypothetical protein
MRRAERRGTSVVATLAIAALGCAVDPKVPEDDRAEAPAPTGFRFVDVAAESGLTRVVLAGRPEKDHLLDSAGSGAAWLDYDGDGRLDAYVVNAWAISGGQITERGRNALYRNRGDGTFEDVTDRAGVGGEGHWGTGVAVADYDRDGRTDILVTTFGPNVLYRNRGDGTFENVASKVGIEAPGWNTGAAFFDADADGDLDLYVAAYIEATVENVLGAERTLSWKGEEKVALGPFGLEGARDHFFRAQDDGRFTDATREAGLEDRAHGYGFAVLAADLDSDLDPDLYVANDSDANYLYRNEGNGTFREVGMWTGAAFDAGGAAQASMGLAAGDVDGDGATDLFVTNFSEDFSTLYRGDGRGFFEDVSDASGVGPATYLPLSWGTVLADLDNDGDLDLVVANGHIYPQVDRHPEYDMTYAQRNLLLENDGTGRFTDASDRAGPAFAQAGVNRGVAAGDYDDDGDVDLLITRLDAPPALLRNESEVGSWLTVVCVVPPGGPTLIGTRVVVETAGRVQYRDVASSGSYLSAHDPRAHFGLGTADAVDRVEVRWTDGTRSVRENLEPNRFVTIEWGS